MKRYPRIFRGNRYGEGMRFKWLLGNHDNMLANDFYADYDITYNIRAASTASSAERYYNTGKVAPNGPPCKRIWIEHGHYYDTYNNDREFAGDGKGYDCTHDYTIRGEAGWMNWLGDLFYDMRPHQTERARQIFQENPGARLVVMGHPHSALLFNWDLFERHRRQGEAEWRRAIRRQEALAGW